MTEQALRAYAVELVRDHVEQHSDDTEEIYWFPDDGGQIRLLEVVRSAPTTYAVFPVSFGPTDDFPVASAVLLVSPAEFEALEKGEIEMPVDWGPFAGGERLFSSKAQP